MSPNNQPRESLAIEPIHLRLAERCRQRVLDGEFERGEKLPSERELAAEYGVSRATVNKGISILIAEGLLEHQKGKGIFVQAKPKLFATLDGMESFTEQINSLAMKPSNEVLIFEKTLAAGLPDFVNDAWDPNYGEAAIFVQRLRLANGIPMILENRWIPELFVPDFERGDVENSFYDMLKKKYRYHMSGENHSLKAVLLDDVMVATLEAPPNTTALLAEGCGFVREKDRPFWFQQVFYRGDFYVLHNETYGNGATLELRLSASFSEKRAAVDPSKE